MSSTDNFRQWAATIKRQPPLGDIDGHTARTKLLNDALAALDEGRTDGRLAEELETWALVQEQTTKTPYPDMVRAFRAAADALRPPTPS